MFTAIKPFIGNIVSLVTLAAGFTGYQISSDQAAQAISAVVMLGGALDTLLTLGKAVLASKKSA